jgi:hypothetical protein
METKRRILVQAIKTEDSSLIPIWDERIVFEKSDMFGNSIQLKGSSKDYSVIECIYDIKTRQLELGIELDYYPNHKELEFKINDEVFYEVSYKNLSIAKIIDIVFEEYDLEIYKGSKLEGYWLERFKNIEIDKNNLYAIKTWKPYYVLDNGVKIIWTYQLFHKV